MHRDSKVALRRQLLDDALTVTAGGITATVTRGAGGAVAAVDAAGRCGQRAVTCGDQDMGHVLVLDGARACGHPGQQRRRGHDPQRDTAERGLPGPMGM